MSRTAQQDDEMPLREDNLHADPIMEIVYHGRGGSTHVTATFPLDRLQQFTELVSAQQQSWADQAALDRARGLGTD